MMLFMIFMSLFNHLDVRAHEKLIGFPFRNCEFASKSHHLDYYIEFMKDGTEYEAEMYLSPSKTSCDGDLLFSIGRTWEYHVQGNEFSSILNKVVVLVSSPKVIPFFNKHHFCDHVDWKVDTLVNCTGKDILGPEPFYGYRTNHEFKIVNDELQVKRSNSDILILKIMKSPVVPLR
jgi:hypothetical protein